MKMKQWLINLILFLLTLIAIGIALLKVTPFEMIGDTYIGVIVSLLSLAVAFVIGYQIYNAVELRKEISEQRKLYDTIVQKNKEMNEKYEEQNSQTQEGFDIISSFICYNRGQSFIECGQAFLNMHRALVSSIKTNRIDYEWIFYYLRLYISQFNGQTFHLGLYTYKDGDYLVDVPGENKQCLLKNIVDDYLAPIKEDEMKIRADKNFCKIQCEYNRVMKIFYNRINSILTDPMKALSPEEQNEIINPKY